MKTYYQIGTYLCCNVAYRCRDGVGIPAYKIRNHSDWVEVEHPFEPDSNGQLETSDLFKAAIDAIELAHQPDWCEGPGHKKG